MVHGGGGWPHRRRHRRRGGNLFGRRRRDWRAASLVAGLVVVLLGAAWLLLRSTPDISGGFTVAVGNSADDPALAQADDPGANSPGASSGSGSATAGTGGGGGNAAGSGDEFGLGANGPLDEAALEVAEALAAGRDSSTSAVVLSPRAACEGLGGQWLLDPTGHCDLAAAVRVPASDTLGLGPDTVLPCPQPLEKILESVVADEIGGDEMRLYLLYRSVDSDLEKLEVSEETERDVQLIAESLREVEDFMRARAGSQRATLGVESFYPIEVLPAVGEFVSGYGRRIHPVTGYWSQHNGTDITGDIGDPIVAVRGGDVLSAQYCGFYGNSVVIYHGAGMATLYAHLDSIAVGPADTVVTGQVIGEMGSTGRSTGPHLHFEVRVDGQPLDPEPFLLAGGVLPLAEDADGDADTDTDADA